MAKMLNPSAKNLFGRLFASLMKYQREDQGVRLPVYVCVIVCVCLREKEKETNSTKERKRDILVP